MSILDFDRTAYPQPSFDPKSISKEAVGKLKPRFHENEEKDIVFFTTRRKKSNKIIDDFYEEALNRFAGFWDNAEAFKKDASIILEKWDLLLGGHDYTAYERKLNVSRIDVALSVYKGRGYTGKAGFLGGNPFCDTALLRAHMSRQTSANAAFDIWYNKRLAARANCWARKFSLNLDAWFEDWWICFKTEIYEGQGQSGCLKTYDGGAGLVRFAQPPVWQFLTREWEKTFGGYVGPDDKDSDKQNGEEGEEKGKRKEKRKRLIQWPRDEDGRDIQFEAAKVDDICSLDLDYWKEQLSGAYAQAFENMSDLERRVFKLRLGDLEDGCLGNAMANRQVARNCNIEDSRASSCYTRAYEKIDDVLAGLYNKSENETEFLRRLVGRYLRPTPRIENLFAKKLKITALQMNDKTDQLVDYLDYTTYDDLFAYCKRIDPQTGKIK